MTWDVNPALLLLHAIISVHTDMGIPKVYSAIAHHQAVKTTEQVVLPAPPPMKAEIKKEPKEKPEASKKSTKKSTSKKVTTKNKKKNQSANKEKPKTATNTIKTTPVSTTEKKPDLTKPSYEAAKYLAHNGQREKAKQMAIALIAKSPTDVDTRILLGQIYAWDDEYDLSREQLTYVINRKPNYVDAWLALINTEKWSKNYRAAFDTANRALELNPGNKDLRMARIRIYMSQRDYYTAAVQTHAMQKEYPGDKDLNDLMDDIWQITPLYASGPNEIFIDQDYTGVSDLGDVWSFTRLSYGRRTPYGKVVLRTNYSRRFGDAGYQYEVDAYPGIARGVYLYLNYGYSNSDLFPDNRYGAEAFFSFSNGWEGSLGKRYLDFRTSEVNIYTGSIAKYVGNYWFAFRPYITPSNDGTSKSYYFTARKYFNADSFISFTTGFGAGTSPDLINFVPTDVASIHSANYFVYGQYPLTKSILGFWEFGYAKEEFSNKNFRESFDGDGGLSFNFW